MEEGLRVAPVPSSICDTAGLYEIGSLWERGRISVTQEHLATSISRLALAQLYQHLASQPQNGKLALVACVEDEFHDLGAHMVADLLDMAGFDTRFLGANVPTASLVAAVRAESPQLLVLSATLTANLDALRRTIIAVRDTVKSRVALAVGGQALAERGRPPRTSSVRTRVGQARSTRSPPSVGSCKCDEVTCSRQLSRVLANIRRCTRGRGR